MRRWRYQVVKQRGREPRRIGVACAARVGNTEGYTGIGNKLVVHHRADVLMGRHQYKKPPIAEAICQIQLLPIARFNVAELARLHERLFAMYPAQTSERVTVQGESTGVMSVDGSPEIQSNYKVLRKTLFPSEDGTRFVAASANEVSIHTLIPYDGWGPFRERIAQVLRACGEAGGPGRVFRIAVRYINRVPFPAYGVPLNTYFTKAPEYPEGVPVLGIASFLSRVECLYPDEAVRLMIVMADVEPKNIEGPAFILDLEVAWASWPYPLAFAEAFPKIEDLKERLSVAFENCVTDEARRVFDVE
jgi:uncharacterized protein (TIGR04255 family)